MYIALYICLFLATLTKAAKKNPGEKCLFRDTVNLTNHIRFENGSYNYRGVLIPSEKTAFYKYQLEFRDKSKPAKLHVRGCICDANIGRYCVKLCCETHQFYNETSFRCETIPESLNKPTDLKIRLKNKKEKKVNIFEHFVNQVGMPCKKPQEVKMEVDPWELLETGILSIATDSAKLDTVSYCITPHRRNNTGEHKLTAMTCPMKNEASAFMLLNTYSMAISVLFLIPTILVYLLVKELRSNLRGKLQICYLVSMTVGYSIISYINITHGRWPVGVCSAIGFSGYFFFMSAYVWLSVLCFDMWNNFKEYNFQYKSSKKNTIRFIAYSVYAWGTAGLLTLIVIWAQLSDVVSELYKPGIGIEMCWLDTRKWSAALYFYLPNCIIMVFNVITFIHLTIWIYTVRRDLAKMTHNEKNVQENIFVIMRLFIIMGISWIMDIISYCARNYPTLEFLFAITDFCNASQGVLIFFLFVLRRKVVVLIKAKFGIDLKNKTEKTSKKSLQMQTTFSRLSGATVPATPTTTSVSSP